MTEIEMYKETLKAVHNEYIITLKSVEVELYAAARSGELTLDGDLESSIYAAIEVACKALKDKMDYLLKEIEENERA